MSNPGRRCRDLVARGSDARCLDRSRGAPSLVCCAFSLGERFLPKYGANLRQAFSLPYLKYPMLGASGPPEILDSL